MNIAQLEARRAVAVRAHNHHLMISPHEQSITGLENRSDKVAQALAAVSHLDPEERRALMKELSRT